MSHYKIWSNINIKSWLSFVSFRKILRTSSEKSHAKKVERKEHRIEQLCALNEQMLDKTHTILRNGSAKTILALNEFDEVMFQFGSELFEEQLQNARRHLHNQTK